MLQTIFRKVMRLEGKNPSTEDKLQKFDQLLENFETLIKPLPESKPRTTFRTDLPIEQVSALNFTPQQLFKVIPDMAPLMIAMNRAAHMYGDKYKPTQSEASPEFIDEFESLAHKWGVKDIGYVKVPRNAIFQDKGIPYEYAIVYTVEMEKEPLETAPSFDAMHEVMHGYKSLGLIGNKMARFLHKHGFAAYPGTALGGVTDYPHLAELAGIGVIGYHGLLISPSNGARLRINVIYTNITNLPTLESQGKENEHLWVRDFCSMCKKCVRKCPVSAIYDQPQPRGDGGMQTIDHATCRNYFTANYGCGVCLIVCPFSQVGYDKVKAKFKGNPNAPQIRIGDTAIIPEANVVITEKAA